MLDCSHITVWELFRKLITLKIMEGTPKGNIKRDNGS